MTTSRIPWNKNLKGDIARGLKVETSDIRLSIWWDDVVAAYISNVPADSPLWILFTGDKERGIVSLDGHEIHLALVGS